MQEVTIEVQRRETVGKGANRRLRAQDLVPAVVYGADREPLAIQVPKKTLLTLFKEGGTRTGSSCSSSPAPPRRATSWCASCRSTRWTTGSRTSTSSA